MIPTSCNRWGLFALLFMTICGCNGQGLARNCDARFLIKSIGRAPGVFLYLEGQEEHIISLSDSFPGYEAYEASLLTKESEAIICVLTSTTVESAHSRIIKYEFDTNTRTDIFKTSSGIIVSHFSVSLDDSIIALTLDSLHYTGSLQFAHTCQLALLNPVLGTVEHVSPKLSSKNGSLFILSDRAWSNSSDKLTYCHVEKKTNLPIYERGVYVFDLSTEVHQKVGALGFKSLWHRSDDDVVYFDQDGVYITSTDAIDVSTLYTAEDRISVEDIFWHPNKSDVVLLSTYKRANIVGLDGKYVEIAVNLNSEIAPWDFECFSINEKHISWR